jgi:beta-phosphoglucomutase-like phosphatase (HAD superfamily)
MIISRLEINALLRVICDGNDVEESKPHPDVFLCAASKLGVRPENCIAIEDGEAGIEAGLAAGMCVVGVGQSQLTHTAYAAFPSLENVKLAELQAVYAAWEVKIGETYPVKGREKAD